MPLSAKLVVVGGEVKTAEIKLRLPSTIGRGRGATIMLPHPLVSRTHCELFESDGRLMVRDLGSLNGTFINNQRVTEAPLPPGELLTVGTVTFRAVYETDEEASGPPSGPAPGIKTPRSQDTDPAGTLRNFPPASSSSKTPVAPMELDFNFAQPLVNFDEEEGGTPPTAKTEPAKEPARTEAAIEDAPTFQVADDVSTSKPGAKAPAAASPAKPAAASPPAKPAAAAPLPKAAPAAAPKAAPAPAQPATATSPAGKPAAAPASPAAPGAATKDAKTTPDSKWKQDDEDAVAPSGEDDDDFNDFLKSLGSK